MGVTAWTSTSTSPAEVQCFIASGARGTLRLLQCIKEPMHLKLAWKQEDSPTAPRLAAAKSEAAEAFDMFGAGSSGGGSGGGAAAAAMVGTLPRHAQRGARHAPAAAPPAHQPARQQPNPIVHEGCELWESITAGHFDWEATLSSCSMVEGREQAGGAQLLVVRHEGQPCGEGPASIAAPAAPAAAAAAVDVFWLQERWNAGTIIMPAAATVLAADDEASQGGSSSSGGGGGGGGAGRVSDCEQLSRAVQRLTSHPPTADLSQLRRDVKSGVVKVSGGGRV
jgi:hypothetical protein